MPGRAEGIDELIAATPDWRGATVAALRTLIHDADPDIAEEVKWRRPSNPNGAAVFEHEGIVCVITVLKQRVRLSFNDGASLPDPHKLFNAMLDGNKIRALDVSQGDTFDEAAVKALVAAGVEFNVARKARRA